MSERDVIQRIFDEFGKIAGCSKKSGSWYMRGPETIVVLNIQKSQYGHQYFVNLAIWLRALGDADAPKENNCHIRTRLTRLVPTDLEERLTALLDLDRDLDEVTREEELLRLLCGHLLPLLKASLSLESLPSGDGRRLVARSLVTGPAQQLLVPVS